MSTAAHCACALSATTLSSVDQPGTKRELSFPFKPIIRKTTLADIDRAAASEPFLTLPLVLVPNPYASWKPPVMHYGWEANVKFLLDLAEEMGCLIRKESGTVDSLREEIKKHYPPNNDKDVNNEEEMEYDDLPKWAGVHTFASMVNVVQVVARQLGICFSPRKLRLVGALKDGQDNIISLYTNYDLRTKIPPEEDIRRLADRLCISEQPKWYLDDTEWTWTPRRYY